MDRGLSWLLAAADPAVRNLARVDLLAEPFDPNALLQSPRVRILLTAPIRGHPYGNKWKGAHWRLVSLIELGVTRAPEVRPLVDQVLSWIAAPRPRVVVEGHERRHASMEGNVLAVCSRLGLAGDPRVRLIKDLIVQSQWPDGGWNCDRRPKTVHSSFHESLATLWGLIEYTHATADPEAAAAAAKAADFFLRHRLFRSERTGRIADAEWLKLHFPPYWHYDVLQALLILSRLGMVDDPRCADALDLLEAKRCPDGTWEPGGRRYWRREGPERVNGDLADWGSNGPNEMLTLNALRVLKAAGRMPRRPRRGGRS
jgi:hypothetical protein